MPRTRSNRVMTKLLFSLCALLFLLVACLPPSLPAQDVVPVPEGSVPSPASPGQISDPEEEGNRCLNGYNIVTCSGENAKFAQAYDWLVLVLIPLAGVVVFLFGPLLAGRRHWWLVQPLNRLWICLLAVLISAFVALFFAPFVPQASPVRFEVGPLSWLFVDGKFIESCLPCRDGVTNPGLLFGRIKWVMPPQGLIPEHPMPVSVVALGAVIVWVFLAFVAVLGLRLKTGIGAGTGR